MTRKARAALGTAGVEPFDYRARLIVAAEIDRCVLRLEGTDAGERRAVRIELG
jgi:hypothetical protein